MASEQGLKLLGVKLSPFVSRIMMSLSLKGINYEFIPEDLQNKSQLLLQSNPVHKKIPVLIHNGKPLCESLVILEYIEETWPCSPHPLLPSNPYDRALARFWAGVIDDKLLQSFRKILTTSDKDARDKEIEEAKQTVAFLEDALKSVGKGKTYFGGDNIGVVDLVWGSFYGMIKTTETLAQISLVDEDVAPALSTLLKALKENEVVKDLLPDPALVIEMVRKRIASQPQ